MFEDLLKRTLQFMGFEVTHVMNITDVDDKTIKGANDQGVSLSEYTEKYIKGFFSGLEILNIAKADFYPRATEHIQEMAEMVKRLHEKGFAYEKDGNYYFAISKFKDYGKLSNIDKRELRTGVRIDSDEYEKESVRDFALWKAKKEGEPYWDTVVGPGRPGWHIECSVMSAKYLGETFDIHCGGVDNIFPHHENEIAQSEAYTGKKFVNYWVHCQHLIRDNQKMSKSRGNIITVEELIENHGADPLAIRLLLLSTHYRKMLNFTFEALDQAKASLDRIRNFIYDMAHAKLGEGESPEVSGLADKMLQDFRDGLCDDLNISTALSALFEMVKKANVLLSQGRILRKDADKMMAAIESANRVLAVFPGPDGQLRESSSNAGSLPDLEKTDRDKIKLREQARADKNFDLADKIRDELLQKGIVLEDSKDGVRWKITKK
jgi:cysteinyl-tRNA synthetase